MSEQLAEFDLHRLDGTVQYAERCGRTSVAVNTTDVRLLIREVMERREQEKWRTDLAYRGEVQAKAERLEGMAKAVTT